MHYKKSSVNYKEIINILVECTLTIAGVYN